MPDRLFFYLQHLRQKVQKPEEQKIQTQYLPQAQIQTAGGFPVPARRSIGRFFPDAVKGLLVVHIAVQTLSLIHI